PEAPARHPRPENPLNLARRLHHDVKFHARHPVVVPERAVRPVHEPPHLLETPRRERRGARPHPLVLRHHVPPHTPPGPAPPPPPPRPPPPRPPPPPPPPRPPPPPLPPPPPRRVLPPRQRMPHARVHDQPPAPVWHPHLLRQPRAAVQEQGVPLPP